MTLAATIRASPPILEATLARAPDVTLAVEGRRRTADGRLALTTWATGSDIQAFETGLDGDDTVAEWRAIGRDCGRGLYELRLTERGGEYVDYTGWTDGAALLTRSRWRADRHVERGLFGSRSTLREFVAGYEASDVPCDLVRVTETDGLPGDHRFGLTDLQAQSLRAAHEGGFYDVPRGTTLRELAATTGVSHQALSERLRRAVGTLVGGTIAGRRADVRDASVADGPVVRPPPDEAGPGPGDGRPHATD
jgi:hypothetical protein